MKKKQDFAWGMKYGIVSGVFISLLSLLASTDGWVGSGDRIMPLSGLVCAYLSAGVFGGLMLGAFRPLTRSARGAALLGWLIGIPSWVLFVGFVGGFSTIVNDWEFALFPALFGSPIAGMLLWFMRRNASSKRRTQHPR